jgi:hypothetical protein
MPSSAEWLGESDDVCVIDTSLLIDLKKVLKIVDQWDFFSGLSELLGEGRIAFPPQVRTEMLHGKFPDTPGAWIARCKGTEVYSRPGDETVLQVLASAPNLIDVEDERDQADPYVLAMALEIQTDRGLAPVRVASKDYIDRMPVKSSLASACAVLGVEHWMPDKFVPWVWERLGEQCRPIVEP